MKEDQLAPCTIYTRTKCPLCDRTKVKLKELGVKYVSVNLDLEKHAEARSYVENVLGARSVPVIVSDVYPPILGYQPDQLKMLAVLLDIERSKE